ncbi:hypothetical protein PC117_g5547 [Phytophthora cactorum]|uniref:Reverse transcriptase Ty1/copia-type domain-containing protein n=1 Tax=Phytophthora cactorum TaxID=29920 RepID=A0A8T1ECL5_9STRA|nr:hypothetical protein PC117_g5547 [Phytophthora cactorum]
MLRTLEENGSWVVVPPIGTHVFHTKWIIKTKIDAGGAIKRFKAGLVACGNEQVFGVDFGLTFAAVMELSTVKVYLEIPQGMVISKDLLRKLGVDGKDRLTLRLKKSLYGLRQAGRL